MKRPTTDGPARRIVKAKPAKAAKSEPKEKKHNADAEWRHRSLRSRPGFLIRRLYQIHVALFMHECSEERVTPVQYSVLTALDQLDVMDQATLARAVALDRTTVADVVARLEGRKLLKRRQSPTDGRMMLASITEAGRKLLERIEAAAERASDETIAALPPKERRAFMESLKQLILANETDSNTSAT